MKRAAPEDFEEAGPLFERPVEPWREVDGRIEAQFEKFHATNPQMFKLFGRFAVEAREIGMTHCAAALIFERMRWETAIASKGEPFKINNNYKPLYARMFMRDNPSFRGFFRTRTLGEKNQWIDDDSPTPISSADYDSEC